MGTSSTMFETYSSDRAHSSVTKKRTNVKCQQCRIDKQKCLPTARDWENQRQRCERCQKLNHPCGPSERIPKRAQQSNLSRSNIEIISKGWNCPSPPLKVEPSESLSSWKARPDPFVQSLPIDHSIGIVTLDHAKDRLTSALAVLQLLLRFQLDSQRYRERAGYKLHTEQEQKFNIILDTLRNDFQMHMSIARWRLGQLSPMRQRQESKDLQLWTYRERMLHCQQWRFRQNPVGNLQSEEVEAFGPIADSTSNEFEVLSCTAHVLTDVPLQAKTVSIEKVEPEVQFRLRAYETVSKKLGRLVREALHEAVEGYIVSCIAGSHGTRCGSDRGFPASHIAYYNGEKQVARELWRKTVGSDQETDMFGRTFAHVVLEAKDMNMLTEISSHDPTAFPNAGIDVEGRSLLHLAAGHKDLDTFAICAARGVDPGSRSRLPDLSMMVDGAAIVNFVRRLGLALPSVFTAMKDALLNGQVDERGQLPPSSNDVAHSSVNMATLNDLEECRHSIHMDQDFHNTSGAYNSIDHTVEMQDYYFVPCANEDNFWSQLPNDEDSTPSSDDSRTSSHDYTVGDTEFDMFNGEMNHWTNPNDPCKVMRSSPLCMEYNSRSMYILQPEEVPGLPYNSVPDLDLP